MVVLWDINTKKRRQNSTLNEKPAVDWSLEQYYETAKRCIGAFTSGPLAHAMIQDEDAISFVAEHLMYGAHRWKENMVNGRALHSYMNQCAIWAIKVWISLSRRAEKHNMLSLNYSEGDNSTGTSNDRDQLYAYIPDEKSPLPEAVMMDQEQSDNISDVISNAGLTPRQQHCIEVVYVQGQRKSDVARDLGISRQAVAQCLEKGIQKIKVAINEQEKLFA